MTQVVSHFIFRKEGFFLKNFKLYIVFLLVPIFIFCFSVASFGAVYENKIFPDLPEDLKDVVVIIYEPDFDSYRLYTSDFVEYSGDSLCLSDYIIRYTWYPETSDSWDYRKVYDFYTLYVEYELGLDGYYYDSDGYRRILVYSNVDIEEDGGDFFFKATPFLTSTILQLPFIHLYWKIMTNLVGGMLCGVGLKIFGIVLAIFLVRRCLRYFL
jgi:hypothetical protein